MSLSPPKSVLILDGTPTVPWPLDCAVTTAGGPLEAASCLTRIRPAFLVINPHVGWHRTFADQLPADRRPAVLGIADSRPPACSVDEWVRVSSTDVELRDRLLLAHERARQRRQSARRVFTDTLTGLPNRRAVLRALVRETSRARRRGTCVTLILMDLDGFKKVNDHRGHPEGDRLLRRLGVELRRATRGNELCGRIGGDEFALVLAGDRREGSRAAKRMWEAARSAGIEATTAVGTLRPDERLGHLYRRVDAELRAAKIRRPSARVPPTDVLVAQVGDGALRRPFTKLPSWARGPGGMTQNEGGRIELHLAHVTHSDIR